MFKNHYFSYGFLDPKWHLFICLCQNPDVLASNPDVLASTPHVPASNPDVPAEGPKNKITPA